ncbi:MAG: tetratricopeptide repeat protein [Bacteroidales bacterium]|nr:tetratricopeptide repeat protein [Bacteroidales bacterium]MBN2750377.1 tetratricopeptide repeat protein [Bacteroidales bacterium]
MSCSVFANVQADEPVISVKSSIDAKNRLAEEYRSKNLDSTFAIASVALHEAKDALYLKGIVLSYNNLGYVALVRKQYAESLNSYFQVLSYANRAEVRELEILPLDLMSVSSDLDKLDFVKPVRITKDEERAITIAIGRAYNNIGLIFIELGNYEKALLCLRQSLKLKEGLNDWKGVATTRYNLGVINSNLENYREATSSFKKSFSISAANGDSLGAMSSSFAIANIYLQQSNVDSALVYIQSGNRFKCVEATQDDEYSYAFLLASVHIKEDKWEQAAPLVTHIEAYWREKGNYTNLAELYLVIADFYMEKRNSQADKYLKLAVSAANSSADAKKMAEAHQKFSQFYERKGNFLKAYNHYVLANQISDSIKDTQLKSAFAEYQILYRLEQKESENYLLRQNKEIADMRFRSQQYWYILIVAIAIVAIMFAVLIYMLYRAKAKSNRTLLEMNKSLEVRVETRTKDLSNALAVAEEANNLKNAFLANISHEIRTPLNGIMGFSSLLSNEIPEDSPFQRYIEEINNSSNRLMHLLNNLVDISRAESNNIRLRILPCELNRVIASAIEQNQLDLRQKGIRVESKLEALPVIMADPENLTRVLSIVINNAIKYSHSEPIQVASSFNEAKGEVSIVVEDKGIGIDADYLPYIFEPFRQESFGLNRSYQGAGLGLPLAKRLLHLMGGRIEVVSRKRVGTQVVISFLIKRNESVFEVHKQTKKASTLGRSQKGVKPKVLIVESNAYTRFYLQNLLVNYAEVTVARDGNAALSIVASSATYGKPFALIILDNRMPQPWTIESFIKEVKHRWPEYKSKGFCAQLNQGETANINMLKAAGCNQVVNKPISKEKLFHLLHTWRNSKG